MTFTSRSSLMECSFAGNKYFPGLGAHRAAYFSGDECNICPSRFKMQMWPFDNLQAAGESPALFTHLFIYLPLFLLDGGLIFFFLSWRAPPQLRLPRDASPSIPANGACRPFLHTKLVLKGDMLLCEWWGGAPGIDSRRSE